MQSPTVRSIVATLVGRAASAPSRSARSASSNLLAISLDEVSEAIGAAPVTMQDIEAIFSGLEEAGVAVDAEPKDPPATLARVLATVRSFSAATGRRPTVPEIAQQSGLSLGEVRFALLYARVLVR